MMRRGLLRRPPSIIIVDKNKGNGERNRGTVKIRTEIWQRKNAIVVKAVIRRNDGTFKGDTNKTNEIIFERNEDQVSQSAVDAMLADISVDMIIKSLFSQTDRLDIVDGLHEIYLRYMWNSEEDNFPDSTKFFGSRMDRVSTLIDMFS